MSETAGYEVRVHQRADAELQSFHPDVQDDVRDIIGKAGRTREPSSLACIRHLKGGEGMLRVKSGDVRVVCALRSPVFGVLLAGKRRTVYDNLDVAAQRAQEVFGDA